MASIRRHPALLYFMLTFTISWGGILIIVGPSHIPATQADFQRLFPVAVLAMIAGPVFGGLLTSALVGGQRGLRDYAGQLRAWRVRPSWYAVALLTAPLLFLAVLLGLSLVSRDYLPAVFVSDAKGELLIRGLGTAIAAGVVEELGWTGVAVPALRQRHGAVATGLIVGVLWALWHFLVKIWGAAGFGMVPFLAVDLLTAVLQLTAYRVLMVWAYDETHSLPLAMLMHFGLTLSTVVLAPAAPGLPLVTANLVIALGWWILVAVIAAAKHRHAAWVGVPSRSA